MERKSKLVIKRVNLLQPVARQTNIIKSLPPIEAVSDKVHAAWMVSKKKQGVTSRLAKDGEELMVPYKKLSEKAKDLDRNTVKAVYAAIKKLNK